MKKVLKLITILLGAIFMLTGIIGGAGTVKLAAADNAVKVEVWKRTDIILISEESYLNPYREVEIDADFTHEDGTKIHLFGFWNGGDEWRVRFSPTKTGTWTYVTSCSDTDNKGLHGVTGKIIAVENTGTTDIDRHGFIRISDNGRYFVHDDGTPFYWLGDTNWQAPNYVSITQCNYPGCDCNNQFVHEVNDRLSKGFTVYQTYFDSGEGDGGGQRGASKEPTMWKRRYSHIDPNTFITKFDVMFDYLADHGMVIALGYGVHASTTNSMNRKDLERLSRYLTARYASYPVVWITAQEITGDPQFEPWLASARIVKEGDGYDHPQGAHMYPLPVSNTFVARLDEEEWHQFYAIQCGHGPTFTSKYMYQEYWDNKRSGKIKPYVETEANYEDITCGGFNGYDASRISAWKANLCGSYGFTYGVTGVWANCYSTAGNTGWMGSFSFEPWYMGIDKPGSYEMTYLRNFFEYVDFSRLVPRFGDTAFSDLKADSKVVSSSDNADTYVAYFYNDDLSTGELRGLAKGVKYSAKWYNPLTGHFLPISDDIHVIKGVYKIPEKPTAADWALLVTSRSDLGDYKTEAPYADDLDNSPLKLFNASIGNAEANILAGSVVSASSVSGASSTADKVIDGDNGTWWCAKDGSFPQYVMFEMPEERSFNTFAFSMYKNTAGASFTLEGSHDGENWDELFKRVALPVKDNDIPVFICPLANTATYKYLKLTFERATANWSAIYEAAAYIDPAPILNNKLPEYKGAITTPAVSCSGSYIYNAAGKASDSIDALFDGDSSTLWKPFAPIGSQTIMMDLGERKAVHGINIMPGSDAIIPRYRIEGSDDGEDWTILIDTTLRNANVFYTEEGRAVSEKLYGAYRYVKLLWFGADGNKIDKTIAGIELYTSDASEAEENPAAHSKPSKKDDKNDRKNIILPVVLGAIGVLATGASAFVLTRKKRQAPK